MVKLDLLFSILKRLLGMPRITVVAPTHLHAEAPVLVDLDGRGRLTIVVKDGLSEDKAVLLIPDDLKVSKLLFHSLADTEHHGRVVELRFQRFGGLLGFARKTFSLKAKKDQIFEPFAPTLHIPARKKLRLTDCGIRALAVGGQPQSIHGPVIGSISSTAVSMPPVLRRGTAHQGIETKLQNASIYIPAFRFELRQSEYFYSIKEH